MGLLYPQLAELHMIQIIFRCSFGESRVDTDKPWINRNRGTGFRGPQEDSTQVLNKSRWLKLDLSQLLAKVIQAFLPASDAHPASNSDACPARRFSDPKVITGIATLFRRKKLTKSKYFLDNEQFSTQYPLIFPQNT